MATTLFGTAAARSLSRARHALGCSSGVTRGVIVGDSSSSSPSSTSRGHARGYSSGGDVVLPAGGATPTMAGAYCESAQVELGREKSPATVGFETGRVARLTNGAVIASMGDTRVICAAVAARVPDPDADFFPLTVDYRERASAYGKIPNTYTKREGAPKDREVLAMRVLDRAVRPLFPKAYQTDTSVQAIVLASDRSQDPSVLAVNGASAALAISSIPWNGPVGAVRVSVVRGEVVINPSDPEIADSDFTLFYAGTEERALMIEAAAMKPAGVPEAVVAAALRAAHGAAALLIAPQRRLAAAVGRPKMAVPAPTPAEAALKKRVLELAGPKLLALYEEELQSKSGRGKAMAELKREIREALREEGAEGTDGQMEEAYFAASSRVMRDLIFDRGVRVDGRKLRQLRELASEVQVLPVVHGSSLFERGNTQTLFLQALATVTIGCLTDVQKLEAPVGPINKRLILHYAFPSFSINETPRRGALSRREIGHGALAEKSLACMLPDASEWPFAVRINAETLESNGSSSMAAVCSGSLALMDAGVPIKEHVGAVSVGLVMEEEEGTGRVTRHELLTDIMGLEDVLGDMDFKIAGTRGGITGIQLDCKPAGIPLDILVEALGVASEGRQTVIDKMEAAIPGFRSMETVSADKPQFKTLPIDPVNIGRLIGPQGKNIKDLEAATGCKFSINDDPGRVGIFAADEKALRVGLHAVQKLTVPLEKGSTHRAKVVEILPFGWVMELESTGERGLLHTSEYSHGFDRVNVNDSELPVGKEIDVMLIEVEPGAGKIRLSRKALLPSPAGALPRPKNPLGRGARGSSAGIGAGAFARNPDGTLKRPLQRLPADDDAKK